MTIISGKRTVKKWTGNISLPAPFFGAVLFTAVFLFPSQIDSLAEVVSSQQTTSVSEKTNQPALSSVKTAVSKKPRMWTKLGRGLKNIITSPLEIQKNMVREGMKADPDFFAPIYGVFYGFMKGTGLMVGRVVSGAVDVLTFPINFPKNWRPLLPIDSFSFEETRESLETA